MLGAPRPLKRGLTAPEMGICQVWRTVGLLYIKIPEIGKLIATHLIIRLVCQGYPRPLKRGLRAPGGLLKCEFVKFEGLLACYISKLIPVIGKLIATHLVKRLVCQGPTRPLQRGLRTPRGPLKCEFVKFADLLACYISKSIPVIGKLIATHLIIRLVCQGSPRLLKRGLGAPGGP